VEGAYKAVVRFYKDRILVENVISNSFEDVHTQFNIKRTVREHEKLFKSENLSSILRDLSDNEEAIIGSIKFYNDNVVVFNQLVSSFPAKIVAFFHHYKRKDFYNDESKEIYELLDR